MLLSIEKKFRLALGSEHSIFGIFGGAMIFQILGLSGDLQFVLWPILLRIR